MQSSAITNQDVRRFINLSRDKNLPLSILGASLILILWSKLLSPIRFCTFDFTFDFTVTQVKTLTVSPIKSQIIIRSCPLQIGYSMRASISSNPSLISILTCCSFFLIELPRAKNSLLHFYPPPFFRRLCKVSVLTGRVLHEKTAGTNDPWKAAI